MTTGTYQARKFPEGYRQLTVSGSVVELADATGGIPPGATMAVIGVESEPMRFRDDGDNPSATVGYLVASGETLELHSREAIKQFRAIRDGASDSTLNISYYSA